MVKKSLNHELNIRGIKKFSEFQIFHNFLNIEYADVVEKK